MAEITAKKVILKSSTGQYVLPYVQPATTDALGTVKPDGITITATADGTISAAGGGSSYRPPLLTSIWSDHLLDNISWLRADTFSWHSGDVYTAAYNKLAEELESTQGIYQVETINGITIKTQISSNGFKFIKTNVADGAERLQAVENLYNSTGIAWYYVIDTDNRRFKLPRTKWGFTGLRTSVGGYIAADGEVNLNHIHVVSTMGNNYGTFVGSDSGVTGKRIDINGAGAGDRGWNGSGSGGGFSAVGNNTDFTGTVLTTNQVVYDNGGKIISVQTPATQMYLYFYAGNFAESAIEQTAGLNAELFNSKQDLLGSNVDYIVDSYADNNGNWYRVYKSGWIKQGGYVNGWNDTTTITLLKPYLTANYIITSGRFTEGVADDNAAISYQARNVTNTSFQMRQTYATSNQSGLGTGDSYAYKWIAEGQGPAPTPSLQILDIINHGLTIDGAYIASGWTGQSTGHYAELKSQVDYSNPWEFYTKIKLDSNLFSSSQGCAVYFDADVGGLRIDVLRDTRQVQFEGSSGSGSQLFQMQSTVSLNLDTDYWLKIQWTGSEYQCYVSTNGQFPTSTRQGAVTSSEPIQTSNIGLLGQNRIGGAISWFDFFKGSIDLKATYFIINGRKWGTVIV